MEETVKRTTLAGWGRKIFVVMTYLIYPILSGGIQEVSALRQGLRSVEKFEYLLASLVEFLCCDRNISREKKRFTAIMT